MKKIYELVSRYKDKFADKTLSFGCIIESDDLSLYPGESEPGIGRVKQVSIFSNNINTNIKSFVVQNTYTEDDMVFMFEGDLHKYKIIGHPLTRGRLIQQLSKHKQSNTFGMGKLDYLIFSR